MSRRPAIVDSDSENSSSDELSDDGSPFRTIENTTVGGRTANDIDKLVKELQNTILSVSGNDLEDRPSDRREQKKTARRKPPKGRKTIYDASSDDEDDDGDECNSSLEDSAIDSAPKPKKLTSRQTNGGKSSSMLDRAPSVATSSTYLSNTGLKSNGFRRYSLSSLGSDSSSSSENSDDDSLGSQQMSRSKKSSENKDFSWSLDKSRKEYKMKGGIDEGVPDYSIPSEIYDMLYDFQKDGIAWMARLHFEKIGGILGDDMGMGKTFMTLSLLGGLMRAKTIRKALVVAPVSVLRNWENEAHKILKPCVRNAKIQVISSDTAKGYNRTRKLYEALESQSCQLVITSFGLVTSAPDDFTHKNPKYFWDYVILDEAHRIKNPSTKVSTNVETISRSDNTRRIILSGTPIMNNLRELHALFHFATSGKVLGSHKEFQKVYGKPIEAARSADATEWEIKAGGQAMVELQRTISPYFLQRLKKDHLAGKLPAKREYVLWTNLSPVQRKKYSDYVQSKHSAIADYFSGVVTSPLFAITWLQKLCGHPLLATNDSTLPDDDEPEKSFCELANYDPGELMRDSTKLQVLSDLMDFLSKKGHRTLIFSQSTKVLDIIQYVLKHRFKLSRIDGQTKEKDRQKHVDEFNRKGSHLDAMLVSTKAGGQGLTLTGADTCIVYDPSWNPAEDSQAVDRAYRIGQDKEVTVFRLITAGTVEEKRYEKQIHKDGIRRAVFTNTGNDTAKYFTKEELIRKKVFVLGEEGECEFLGKLAERGLAFDENENPAYTFTFHRGVVGQSSHDIVYSGEDWNNTTKLGGEAHPFSSPTKIANWHSQSIEKHPTKPSSPEQKQVLGKAQRVLAREGHQTKARSQEKENHTKIQNISVVGKPSALDQSVGYISKNALEDILERMEHLGLAKQSVKAHDIAMDLIEGRYGAIPNNEKLDMHRRIAIMSAVHGWI